MKKIKLVNLNTIIISIMFVLSLGGLIFLPFIYNMVFKNIGIGFKEIGLLYQLVIYIIAIFIVIIMYMVLRIFKNIEKENAFDESIYKNIRIVSICLLGIFLTIGVKAIIKPSILSIALVVISFIGGLSFNVIAQVYKQAIEYKKESDYTV